MGRRFDRFFDGHPKRLAVAAFLLAGGIVAAELDELLGARTHWPSSPFMKAVAIGSIVGTLLPLALLLAGRWIQRNGATDENNHARQWLSVAGAGAVLVGWGMARQSRFTPDPPVTSLTQVGALAFVATCVVWLSAWAIFVLWRTPNRR